MEPIVVNSIQTRRRVSVQRNASGGFAFDFTVETYGDDPEALLTESDKLRHELEKRYPAKTKEEK